MHIAITTDPEPPREGPATARSARASAAARTRRPVQQQAARGRAEAVEQVGALRGQDDHLAQRLRAPGAAGRSHRPALVGGSVCADRRERVTT